MKTSPVLLIVSLAVTASLGGCNLIKSKIDPGTPEQIPECKAFVTGADKCIADTSIPETKKFTIKTDKKVLFQYWETHVATGTTDSVKDECDRYNKDLKHWCG